LTGIGFTMSLFIRSLAFQDEQIFQYTDKLAILIASFVSGISGYLILKYVKNEQQTSASNGKSTALRNGK